MRELSDFFKSVHWWFTLNGLPLNQDNPKPLIIIILINIINIIIIHPKIIGTGTRQRSEGSLEVIDLGNVHIQPSESFRSLGVVIDNTMSFDTHVNSVCNAFNYHAKALRHIRERVTTEVALTIASTIGARLDYCNAILHGTSKSNIQKVKRAQNSIARIVTGTRRSEHITWLHCLK